MLFYNYLTNKIDNTQKPDVPIGYCLVHNKYFSINRADILQKMGKYPVSNDTPTILGLELAGEVCFINDKDINNSINNPYNIVMASRIMAIVKGGAYAEFVLVPLKHCIHIPNNLSYKQASSLPEAIFTVWHALFNIANLIKDIQYNNSSLTKKTIYINAASSGIGTMAIQICLNFGFNVIACTSSSEKVIQLQNLFKDIKYNKNTILNLFCSKNISLQDYCINNKVNFDIGLDMLGNINEVMQNINYNGKIISIAYLQGAKTEINIALIMQKQLQLSGTMLRLQSEEIKSLLTKQIIDEVIPYIELGRIKPIIYKNYTMQQIQQAHDELLTNQHIGKLIVEMQDSD